MSEEKWINVNELNRIIAKHFGRKSCNTIECEVGSFGQQNNPTKFTLGGGCKLTIKFDLSEK